jgi:hypothetical protein
MIALLEEHLDGCLHDGFTSRFHQNGTLDARVGYAGTERTPNFEIARQTHVMLAAPLKRQCRSASA